MSLRSTPPTMAVVAALALAACSPDRALAPSATPAGASAFDITSDVPPGELVVCKKTGPAIDAATGLQIPYHFTAAFAGGSGYTTPVGTAFDLVVGQCTTVWKAGDATAAATTITIAEVNLPALAQLDSIIHYYWGPTVLGSISNAMSVTLDYSSNVHYIQFFNADKPAGPGTGTIGYWKTHPEAWPVSSIVIGGVTYSKTAAINLMLLSPKGDMTLQMFSQLVGAKLNLLMGTTASCISSAIAASDTWMASHAPGTGVAASSATWQSISSQYILLDQYNNGLLCAPHR